jgi:hypothetical protein
VYLDAQGRHGLARAGSSRHNGVSGQHRDGLACVDVKTFAVGTDHVFRVDRPNSHTRPASPAVCFSRGVHSNKECRLTTEMHFPRAHYRGIIIVFYIYLNTSENNERKDNVKREHDLFKVEIVLLFNTECVSQIRHDCGYDHKNLNENQPPRIAIIITYIIEEQQLE